MRFSGLTRIVHGNESQRRQRSENTRFEDEDMDEGDLHESMS